MPLVKVHRLYSSTIYDIAHTVSGSLNFGTATNIEISDALYQGPGIYQLYKGYTSVTGIENLQMVVRPTSGFSSDSGILSVTLY